MRQRVDWGALYAALEAKRDSQRRSWRVIANELDVSPSVFTRLAHGHTADVDTFLTLSAWLGVPAETFVEGDEQRAPDSEATLAVIASSLRADRALKPRNAEAIETVLRAAYDHLADDPAKNGDEPLEAVPRKVAGRGTPVEHVVPLDEVHAGRRLERSDEQLEDTTLRQTSTRRSRSNVASDEDESVVEFVRQSQSPLVFVLESPVPPQYVRPAEFRRAKDRPLLASEEQHS
jgi:transcriptional regulator with XRE-family HTH domain